MKSHNSPSDLVRISTAPHLASYSPPLQPITAQLNYLPQNSSDLSQNQTGLVSSEASSSQLISNTNSNLYMWESIAQEQIEFENDLIASTNEVVFTNKQLMQRYESEYFREPMTTRQRREIGPRALNLLQ